MTVQRIAPHSECCPVCWETLPRHGRGSWLALRAYAARSDEPDPQGDGYTAGYRCTEGHTWRTWWAGETRLARNVLATHLRLTNLAVARHVRWRSS